MRLKCASRELDLSRPAVMGILNVTPDSFSDGGRFNTLDSALRHTAAMVAAGVDIVDVGGESTRPGSVRISVQEELDRVIPVVEGISSRFDVVVSVDTSTPEVMTRAAAAGAGILNDVRGLRREGALEAVAATGLPVCVMHMQGEPEDMQDNPTYRTNVVDEVCQYLQDRISACEAAGIKRENIILDPGFGFGKTLDHNLSMMKHMEKFLGLEQPLLVGVSRKSMIGKVLDRPVDERLYASLGLAAMAAMKGAHIIRVHDVPETRDVVDMLAAVMQAE
ncbi:dihydropteroate synthase [Endozoicomonadaceae bacterium StTr2]